MATLRPVASWMSGTRSRMRCNVRSSGPRTARTRQNSDAPSAAVSAAAARTSSVSRNGVALTGESKRDDCEQKWQSSGQPPVLAERMPSISTCGAAPCESHLMGERREVHDRTVGQRGERRELVPAQQTALVEEGRLGSGNDGSVRRAEGDLGRGGRVGTSDWRCGAGGGRIAEGDGARCGHGAHGSGRVGTPSNRERGGGAAGR